MFEKIIGYDTLVLQCKDLIKRKTMPASLLISGAKYSGKLSIALEFARVLQCEKQGDVNCTCSNCKVCNTHRHSDIKILGPRNFLAQMNSLFNFVLTNKQEVTRQALLQVFYMILARTDIVVWEHTEAWSSGIKLSSNNFANMLYEYEQDEKQWFSTKSLGALRTSMIKLCQTFPAHMYNVTSIRNISSWAKISSHSNVKVIILECADKMSDNVENMLLKILEEPPENTIFFLLSENPHALLMTTRSRLFLLEVPLRAPIYELQVMERIYGISEKDIAQDDMSIRTVRNFIQYFSQVKDESEISSCVRNYLNAIEQKHQFDYNFLSFLKSNPKMISLSFLELIRYEINKRMFTIAKYSKILPHIWNMVEESRFRIETYNLAPKYVLESMYYSLANIYEKFSVKN